MKKKFLQGFAITAMTAALAACGGDGGSDEAATGTVSVGMTDAPVDSVQEVNVTVTGLVLQPAGDGGERRTFTLDEPAHINLLDLQNGDIQQLVTDEEVVAGDYSWMRLELADDTIDNFSVVPDGGGEHPLTVPSGQQRGLQTSGFTVPAGGVVNFTIDFDVRKSLTEKSGNEYILRPTLRLTDNSEVGKISGSIDSTLVSIACADNPTEMGPSVYAGNVYIYTGEDATVDDYGSDNEPLVSVPVDASSADKTYTAAFLPEGNYTVSYSCDIEDQDADGNEVDEDITFYGTQNATVAAGETTTVDFVSP
ncbi:DUF4382 domain-containing protein [Marinobacter halodurans]|uniref:DUF4382 domain-containing protein n=1 Tax=Marinobacter halodurans TaxID=2528979 RepID=A0ABY1ZFQ3_9GAMM|nr:DUF4382 domain-containing protein [Marinobacter halodurans]TBW49669.1 DUF4382 domain-containing protein [Marinobacter halodurans]